MSRPRLVDPYRSLILLGLISLLAFALRIYLLEAQSMWSDEGLTLYRAGIDLVDVWRNTIVVDGIVTQDRNPPLFFLLLNLWQRIAGMDVFVLRFLPAMVGVLSVALIYRLGRLAAGFPVGAGAALLLAVSPFHVWMSQELRNYSLLVLFNLASVYGLFRLLRSSERKESGRSRRWWFLLWAGAGLLGVYTHYFGFFVLAYGVLALIATFVWRRWRPPWWLLLIVGLASLALLPLFSLALDGFRAGRQFDFHFVPLGTILRQTLNAYTVGINWDLFQPGWRVWPVVLTAGAGLFLLFWRRKTMAAWLLLGYTTVPLALLLLLSQINPLYNGPRHVLIGLPPFLLLVAAGLFYWPGRWRTVGAILALFLLLSQGQWLWVQFHDPALAKDDVRGAAQFLNREATADDLIILHDTLIRFTFEHYYEGEAPVVSIPQLWHLPEEMGPAELAMAVEGAERVWFLVRPTPRTGYPPEQLWRWADRNWPRFADLKYAGLWLRVQLNGYTPDPTVSEWPSDMQALDVDVGEAVHLQGVTIPPVLAAGQTSWPVLYLSRLNPTPGNYTLSFRFVDETGRIWEQADGLLWNRFPPVDWPENEAVRYDHALALPGGIPPGNYQLWLRVLDNDLQPIPVSTGGVDTFLSDVAVQSSKDEQNLPPMVEQDGRLGPLTLLGYTTPDGDIRPGHVAPLSLFWRVRQAPTIDYELQVEMLDEENNVVLSVTSKPSRDDYPTTAWQPEERLRSPVDMVIPGNVMPGSYRLRVTLRDPATEEDIGRGITLDTPVSVAAWPFEDTLPPIQTPSRATLGEPPLVEFQGYELLPVSDDADLQANALALTLFWQGASSEVDKNYNVFVHLVDEEGNIVAQVDGSPVQGVRPTIGWREGEVIVDQHRVDLPSVLPEGRYRLYVGLYDPETFARLPIKVDGVLQPDGRLLLETLER